MPFFEDGSFDFINFAYVIHEMPGENAKAMVREMYRLLAPGGVLNGFEVPYKKNEAARDAFVLSNTWGYDWDVAGDHGPEPYIAEFEYNTLLPLYMEEIGFERVEDIHYNYFESIFLGYKPAAN